MFGTRPSATILVAATLASCAVACGSGHSDKPAAVNKPVAGTLAIAECTNNGWTRRVRLLDVRTKKVIRTNYFNVNNKEFQSLGDCASILSGPEQRAIYNDDFSRLLAVRSVNDIQHFGWIGHTDTTTGTVNNETPFQSEMNTTTDRGALFGGVYDRSGTGIVYYVDQTGNTFQLFSDDGQVDHSIKDLGNEGTHNVFLPMGSTTPQPIDTSLNLPVCTAFKGSHGFAVQGSGVLFGSQRAIYTSKADIALGNSPAPCPIKVLNEKQYIGFTNQGFFKVTVAGNKATFTTLLSTKGVSNAVAGPDNSVAYSISGGSTTTVYTSGLDGKPKPKLITSSTAGRVDLLEFFKQ